MDPLTGGKTMDHTHFFILSSDAAQRDNRQMYLNLITSRHLLSTFCKLVHPVQWIRLARVRSNWRTSSCWSNMKQDSVTASPISHFVRHPKKNRGAKTNRHPNSSYVSRQHQILCGLEHPDVSLPESLCVCIIIMSQRKHWFYEKRFHPKPPSFIVFPPSQDPLFLTGSIRFSHNYETKKKTHRAMGNLQG